VLQSRHCNQTSWILISIINHYDCNWLEFAQSLQHSQVCAAISSSTDYGHDFVHHVIYIVLYYNIYEIHHIKFYNSYRKFTAVITEIEINTIATPITTSHFLCFMNSTHQDNSYISHIISTFTVNGQNIAGIGYILYLRNISFSSVLAAFLHDSHSTSCSSSVRHGLMSLTVQFGFCLSNSSGSVHFAERYGF